MSCQRLARLIARARARTVAVLPPWAWVVAILLPIRLPLLLHPEPGRDEAAYWYWSRHPEPGYAPLMQILVWVASLLPIPDVVALRVPSLAAGVAVIVLFDRWLVRAGATKTARWTALLALGLAPWQTYVGALLHPDGLFLTALLAFALAASGNRVLLTAGTAVLAAWAKPTGFLLAPVTLWLWFRDGTVRTRRGLGAAGLLALGLAPVAGAWNLEMIREVMQFGSAWGEVPMPARLAAFSVSTLVAGGLLVPAAALSGAWSRAPSPLPETGRPAARAAALALLLGFGAAALLAGQFKPNWILPAAVLLWPRRAVLPRRAARWGLAGSAVASLALSLAFTPLGRSLDRTSPAAALLEAGFLREESLAREVQEWHSVEGFASQVESALGIQPVPGGRNGGTPPKWIVADDYGLAAQLAYRWRAIGVRIHVPSHGLFTEPSFSDRGFDHSAAVLTIASVGSGTMRSGPELEEGLVVPDPVAGTATLVRLADGFDSGPAAGSSAPPRELHAAFDTLLTRYVTPEGVRYAAWRTRPEDVSALSAYVDRLEAQRPSRWQRDHALAFWINLYNSATLELVLAHYPVKSIKDIGGLLSSPWKRQVVQVEGRKLSLDNVEHDVVRKRFGDARIHFALNCASIGCPPLAQRAFGGEQLDAMLEAACRRTLGDRRWVAITPDETRLTRIFDWYRGDFERAAGSVPEFVARYRPEDREALLSPRSRIAFLDYDWRLNER